MIIPWIFRTKANLQLSKPLSAIQVFTTLKLTTGNPMALTIAGFGALCALQRGRPREFKLSGSRI